MSTRTAAVALLGLICIATLIAPSPAAAFRHVVAGWPDDEADGQTVSSGGGITNGEAVRRPIESNPDGCGLSDPAGVMTRLTTVVWIP